MQDRRQWIRGGITATSFLGLIELCTANKSPAKEKQREVEINPDRRIPAGSLDAPLPLRYLEVRNCEVNGDVETWEDSINANMYASSAKLHKETPPRLKIRSGNNPRFSF